MNSEISPNPESDNQDLVQSRDQAEELAVEAVESNSPATADIWLDESPSTPESEQALNESESATAAYRDRRETESETMETESTNWLEDEEEIIVGNNEETQDLKPLPSEVATASEPVIAPDSTTETELFTDRWLDEPQSDLGDIGTSVDESEINTDLNALKQQKNALNDEIATLKAQKEAIILQQARDIQETLGRFVEEGMKELKERKNALQIEIEKLERRRERIRQEMRTTFAGSSQELAIRVQGFKDYLVGSLQDLAVAAEKLELSPVEPPKPSRDRVRERESRRERATPSRRINSEAQETQPQFTESAFATQTKKIRQLLDLYRTRPDYYGPPWQLRRTFEPVHAEKVQQWFFTQGGRGAIDSMSSRLQNILVASATISILHSLYGDRCRVLVLIDTPEKLGEWRRGLQDCLGIARSDFGSNRGVVLFDSAEVVVQRAERLVKDKLLPFIIIDETEELINISLLKFPLWLAFASTNKSASSNYLY
ncbi:MAG: DUF3086 domain-containing protein [Pleurocapsa sp.]